MLLSASLPMTNQAPTILVVDDEDDIRSSLRMILEYEGMQMVEASSGAQALSNLGQLNPDAVLLDIKMRGMDGLEVLAQLRQLRPELPVVMISGHGTISTAVEATRLVLALDCQCIDRQAGKCRLERCKCLFDPRLRIRQGTGQRSLDLGELIH